MPHTKWDKLTVVKDARRGWTIMNRTKKKLYRTRYSTKLLAQRKKLIMEQFFRARSQL